MCSRYKTLETNWRLYLDKLTYLNILTYVDIKLLTYFSSLELTTDQQNLPYNKFETAIQTIETIFKCYKFYSTPCSPSYW